MPPPLSKLISRVREIVAAKDQTALSALILPSFRVEFDSGIGPVAFRKHWHPESADSPLWSILSRLFALPAHRYSDSLYSAPYVFAAFPFDLDPLAHVVGLREGVALLAEPKADAKRVGTVNREIIPLAQPMQPPVVLSPTQFVEARHPQAGRCFIASADVYHPAAHRAFFEKRAGKWQWISLAAATLQDPPDLHLRRPPQG